MNGSETTFFVVIARIVRRSNIATRTSRFFFVLLRNRKVLTRMLKIIGLLCGITGGPVTTGDN